MTELWFSIVLVIINLPVYLINFISKTLFDIKILERNENISTFINYMAEINLNKELLDELGLKDFKLIWRHFVYGNIEVALIFYSVVAGTYIIIN